MSKLAVLELKGNLSGRGFYVALHISQGELASSTALASVGLHRAISQSRNRLEWRAIAFAFMSGEVNRLRCQPDRNSSGVGRSHERRAKKNRAVAQCR